MKDVTEIIGDRLSAALGRAFGNDFAQADTHVGPATNPRFGDYQSNVAMGLAKPLGRKPRDIAEAIKDALEIDDIATDVQIAGPGFINITLRNDWLSRVAADLLADPRRGVPAVEHPSRVVVDYSSPNVAKEMHVGHLRSTVIGDAIVRTLEFQGHQVIRQNHVGDWGTQFGMLIEFVIENGDLDETDSPGPPQAGRIGDLNHFYRQAKKRFDVDADFADRARQRVVKLQQGDEDTLRVWRYLVEESKRHFEAIYERLGVTLTENDIRPESFYNDQLADVVEELERQGLAESSEGALCVFLDSFKGTDGEPLPLIIRKRGGGYLYATTDLAAVRHRVRDLQADRVIYVTDARQKQHFAMFFEVARRAGWAEGVRLEHVVFGTILGEDNRPFKTRSGETVRLVDLLDEAEQRATAIVTEKNPELDEQERKQVAHVVGIGAVKYGDLSSDRVKDYVFSWNRMLAMEGNTAPYLQYAYTRIRSIQRKAAEQGLQAAAAGDEGFKVAGQTVQAVEQQAERALVLKLVQFASAVSAVSEQLEPHRMCTYLFELATTFSSFYENCPVLRAETPEQAAARLALCEVTAATLKQGLNLLGIDVLERM